jgi:hypothetical protein
LLILPKLVDRFGIHGRLARGCIGGFGDRFVSGSGGESRSVLIIAEKIWRVLRQLRDGNQTGQVAQIGALVVELDQAVMLGIVTSAKGCEDFVVSKGNVHGAQHAGDELVDSVALLNQGYQTGDLALVVQPASKVSKNELLECLNLVLEVHEVGDGLVSRPELVYLYTHAEGQCSPFVRVVDRLQTNVLLILECSYAHVSDIPRSV